MQQKYILTCDAGTSRFIKEEILEKFPQAIVSNFENLPTKILVENLDIEQIKPFRFYYNIIALQNFCRLPDCLFESFNRLFIQAELPFLNKGESFRVTAKRYGTHNFSSVDLQKSVGQIIVDRFQKKVSLEKFDVHFRIDIVGNLCFWGEQLTSDAAESRIIRPFVHRAGIKQTLAHALVRTAALESGMSVLDCTCGSGTILAEIHACFGGEIALFGLDLHEEYAAGAKENMAANGVIASIHCGDAREMSAIFTQKFDRVISNLPFGMVSGKNMDIKSFYFKMTEQLQKVLRPDGRAVLFTARAGMLKEVLLISKKFFILEEFVFDGGSLSPHVLVLQKTEQYE